MLKADYLRRLLAKSMMATQPVMPAQFGSEMSVDCNRAGIRGARSAFRASATVRGSVPALRKLATAPVPASAMTAPLAGGVANA